MEIINGFTIINHNIIEIVASSDHLEEVIAWSPNKRYFLRCSRPTCVRDCKSEYVVACIFEADKPEETLFSLKCNRHRTNMIPKFIIYNQTLYLFNNFEHGEFEIILVQTGKRISSNLCLNEYECDSDHCDSFITNLYQVQDSNLIFDGWVWHPIEYQYNINLKRAIETGKFTVS